MNSSFSKLLPVIKYLQKYSLIIMIAAIGATYSYIIYTSGQLAKTEPSEAKIAEKYSGAKRPKIDKAITDKLNELQDSNIQFKALIDEARKNPFLEQ